MAKDALRFLNLDPNSNISCSCDILDKSQSILNYVQYMFDRSNRMFKYSNLPDTIPEPVFEYMIQVYGSVGILEVNGSLYAFRGEFGGPPDPYYRPTQFVVANPALALEGTYRVVNHLPPFDRSTWESYPPCVRLLNDSQIMGLLPMFSRYATQLAENDISIRSAQINSRQQVIIAADTGQEIESANEYMKSLEEGRLSSIQKRPFTEGVNVFNASQTGNHIIQLIQLQQYIRASLYNEIGLESNYNMKREYISPEEASLSDDMMLPLVDNMLESRRQGVDAINRQFSTNISVEKDSAWKFKQEEFETAIEDQEAEEEIVVSETSDDGKDSEDDSSEDTKGESDGEEGKEDEST